MSNLKRLLLAAGMALALLPPPLLAQTALLPTRRNDPALWGTFISCITFMEQWVGPSTPDWVFHTAVYDYPARKPLYDGLGRPLLDAEGRPRTATIHQSGRVFYPPAWRVRGHATLPIVIYSHGTSMMKDEVASEFGGHEWLFAAAAAAYYGFAVAMPDGPGMGGDGTSYHPFCHGRSLAYAVVDGIPALRAAFDTDPYLAEHGYVWDGRVYLMGYSEGGYASLAAAREMETHKDDFAGKAGFMLAGSACMAGPFDLSGTVRRQILDPATPFKHPFFLPFVVFGYHAVYGALMDPVAILAPEIMKTEDNGNVEEWANGSLDGPVVDELLGARLGVPKDEIVSRTLFNPAWVARELDDPAFRTSALRPVLEENDVARGWTPSRPILFGQSPDDRDVPIQNAWAALAALGGALRSAGQDPSGKLLFRLVGEPGHGPSHVGAIFGAIPMAFDWIYRSHALEAPRAVLSASEDAPTAP